VRGIPSPLENLPLTDLACRNTKVAELSALKGMKLRKLDFSVTEVSDLSPLKGMPLTELYCHGANQVSDLSPLRGMKLTSLVIAATKVDDLSPLEGMPLTKLLFGATQVSDLSPLKRMPLTNLDFESTRVMDLSPIQGMNLTSLGCNDTNVSDLSPLEGMRLNYFQFTPKNITKGVHVIRQMKSLETFGIRGTNGLTPGEFWKKYDAGEFGRPPITTFNDPAFQQWVKEVQAMPAEQQVEAVSKKLMELNPGFDGKVTHWTNNGMVTSLIFLTDEVSDISPLRVFHGLEQVQCFGDAPRRIGKLSDLSPLKGMKLNYLNCGSNLVSDLSPLQGMPLKTFGCNQTPVSDLKPLSKLSLEDLWVADTPVTDLSPLSSIKTLKQLSVVRAKVTSEGLATLQDALPQCRIEWPLQGQFYVRPSKPITDFNSPAFQQWVKDVQAMPAEQQVEAVSRKLMELNPGFDGKVTGAYETGTPQIENNVVTEIGIRGDNVTDISPVRALSGVNVLTCVGSSNRSGQLSDLSPIRGMSITALHCYFTQVSDLSPLQGMALTKLDCGGSKASDLTPLKGMPLKVLNCGNMPIFDLSPLRGLPLAQLDIYDTPVSDLSLLKEMNLATFLFTPKNITKGMDVIRHMKSLQTIGIGWEDQNKWPTSEFWIKYDAGEFGKPESQ